MVETRRRIIDVALDVLGDDPDAGMGEIAAAAGVVRRTVYGHFPTRTDLIRTLAQQAIDDLVESASGTADATLPADEAWMEFVARLWPFAERYRFVVALRRGEYGHELHALLEPLDELLSALVDRGQRSRVFSRHLPPTLSSQLAYGALFAIAESRESPDMSAAALTSLMILGVSEARAKELVRREPLAGAAG